MESISPRPRASIGTWLLRIFLCAFLLAILAPVALAFAVFHVSGDTRALRNAVVDDSSTHWKRRVELNAGPLPFVATRFVLPFIKQVDPDIKQAATAIGGMEVSVHELVGSQPDRARILTEADASMSKRGWDRTVCVLERDTAVAVYVKANPKNGDFKISTLVLNEKIMVAATGSGNLNPVMEVALRKAEEQLDAMNLHHPAKVIVQRD
jgi:hypothetical protein